MADYTASQGRRIGLRIESAQDMRNRLILIEWHTENRKGENKLNGLKHDFQKSTKYPKLNF